MFNRVAAATLGLGGVLLLIFSRSVRVAEAWLQVLLLETLQIDAHQVGTSLLVLIGQERVGIAMTAGCSIGPLLAIFLLSSAPLLWFRPVALRRVAVSFAALAFVLILANQIRIAVIAVSMRTWGIDFGYNLSHVFLGSAITTVGFVLGVVIFARLFIRRRSPER